MSPKQTKEEDKEHRSAHGPNEFAAMCESMMANRPRQACESQMRELMLRCMAPFSGHQTESEDSDEKGEGDHESERRKC
jgi:hypothetical protein